MIPETRLIKWETPEICTNNYCPQSHFSDGKVKNAHFYKDGEYNKDACYLIRSVQDKDTITVTGYVFYTSIWMDKQVIKSRKNEEVSYKETYKVSDLNLVLDNFLEAIQVHILVKPVAKMVLDYLKEDILLTQLKGFTNEVKIVAHAQEYSKFEKIPDWEI